MQWLARICVQRPVFALMLIAAVVVAGAASYPQLGIDRFPNIDLPVVRVRTVPPKPKVARVRPPKRTKPPVAAVRPPVAKPPVARYI